MFFNWPELFVLVLCAAINVMGSGERAMTQTIVLGHKAMMADAESRVGQIDVDAAIKRATDPDVVIVDIRDIRELEREGKIPGAFHAPRGLLEFWVDLDSPYHKPIFAEDKTFIIHCASGWRSLLATDTLDRMGLKPVLNMRGGFAAWKEAGGPIEQLKAKT
jgi:rhodanese-related sulfurtransferase